MRIRSLVLASATATALFSTAVAGQEQSNEEFWRGTWFWGAQGGVFLYSAGGTTNVGVATGGHWFITSGRSAFSLSFDQMFLPTTSVNIGTNPASFSSAQRLSATLYALPSAGGLQLYMGGGFALTNLTDAAPTGTFASPAAQTSAINSINQVSTKAFAILGGGAQMRLMSKWVLYGQYHFMPGTGDFMITSPQHLIQGGVRYALTKSKETVTTER